MQPSISRVLSNTPATQCIYFPKLDGLRCLAVFSVFLFHSFYSSDMAIWTSTAYRWAHGLTRSGGLGVNFFFLSAFLITYLLPCERQATGRIAIGPFCVWRILRIWPLYFVVLLLGFVILPIVRAHFGEHKLHETAHATYFWLFLAYFNNLYYNCQTPTLKMLWSVCVEEQLYLVWLLLLTAVPTRRLGWLFGGILVSNMLFRAWHQDNTAMHNLRMLSVICDIALGGTAAWLCFRDNCLTSAVTALPRWACCWCAARFYRCPSILFSAG